MKRLHHFIQPSQINEGSDEIGYSNYFSTVSDFIGALNTNNAVMKRIFKDPKGVETKRFVHDIYKYLEDNNIKVPCDFYNAPLIFNINTGIVKLKNKYNETELAKIYDTYQNVLCNPYQIGDGSQDTTTKIDTYKTKFIKDSVEYLTYVIMGGHDTNMKLGMSPKHKMLFSHLFNKIKINEISLYEYVSNNKATIVPDEVVNSLHVKDEKFNAGGNIINFNNNQVNLNVVEMQNTGRAISDVQYKFNDVDVINIVLQDKKYYLSELSMSRSAMNAYPDFDLPYDKYEKSTFRAFCDYIGLNYKKIYDDAHNPPKENKPIKINSKYYYNIAMLFKIALGDNYYIVSSLGYVHGISIMEDDDIMISYASVEYPTHNKQRININIIFDSASKVTGSVQLSIRSNTGRSEDYGFHRPYITWRDVNIHY